MKNLEKKYGKIAIQIASKDRASEVGLLLESLMFQTYQNFNIYILDDGSQVPLTNFYFINYLVARLKLQGHNVKIIKNNIASGVSKARQQLVDYVMKYGKEKLYCRIDDDSICDSKFLEKLIEGIESGYALVGCIVSPIPGPDIKRDIKYVEPVINLARLNNKGELIQNEDSCGYRYTEEKIIPAPHFRSSCLYKKEIHEAGVDYNSRLSKNGFREENIFSWKCLIKGFKIAIHTGAINWHLATPSGGERDTMNMTAFNQEQFDLITKKMFENEGDFLQKYYDKLGITLPPINENELLKATNLITRK